MASRSYRLKADESPAKGLLRIASGRAEKAQEKLSGADEQTLASAIHGARKDLKKLRSVMRLARAALGEELFKAENRRYRDAGRLLAGSRDAEAKLATLVALRSRFGNDFPQRISAGWEGLLELERDELVDAEGGETAQRIDAALAAIEQGRDRIAAWPLRDGSWRLVGPGIFASYRHGRRAMRQTRSEPSAENVHAWRKRAKDLWYQLRILRGAWPGLLEETAGQVHALADLLGDHHDLAVLGSDLADRADAAARQALEPLIELRQEELLGAALELGKRVYAEKPKAFRRRLHSYWSAWR
jgi:CHAD domain-containing protein